MAEQHLVDDNQYLTFILDEEGFALEIAKVREVLSYLTITKVPRTPEFLRGVINLRGNVVPVVDLRLKLGMSAIQRTVDTCIVIVEIVLENELLLMGVLADSVQEVINLEPADISPPPRLGTRINIDFIKGMGKHDERFLIMLDIDKVLSAEELNLLNESRTHGEQHLLPEAKVETLLEKKDESSVKLKQKTKTK